MIIDKLNNKSIEEMFECDGEKFKVKLNFVDDEVVNLSNIQKENDKINVSSKSKNIIVSSSGSTKILEKYVNMLIKKCNEKISNDILIFKLTVTDKKIEK
jgi:hypothetical protein